jgi:hypothetical protein
MTQVVPLFFPKHGPQSPAKDPANSNCETKVEMNFPPSYSRESEMTPMVRHLDANLPLDVQFSSGKLRGEKCSLGDIKLAWSKVNKMHTYITDARLRSG